MSRVKVARFGCAGMAPNPFRPMHQHVELTRLPVLFELLAEQLAVSAAYFKVSQELTANVTNEALMPANKSMNYFPY